MTDAKDIMVFEGWDRHLVDAMTHLNARTWADLAALTAVELLQIKGLHTKRLAYLQRQLERRGLCLAERPAPGTEWATIRPARAPVVAGVYFLGCGEFIKIGCASDVQCRVVEFALYNPNEVELLTYEAIYDKAARHARERELHRQFRSHRHRLEWYRPAPAIIEHIAAQNAALLASHERTRRG